MSFYQSVSVRMCTCAFVRINDCAHVCMCVGGGGGGGFERGWEGNEWVGLCAHTRARVFMRVCARTCVFDKARHERESVCVCVCVCVCV